MAIDERSEPLFNLSTWGSEFTNRSIACHTRHYAHEMTTLGYGKSCRPKAKKPLLLSGRYDSLSLT